MGGLELVVVYGVGGLSSLAFEIEGRLLVTL